MASRAKGKVLTKNGRNLTRRYLVWCYKTTKEELDKIDRYFTQLAVDRYVLAQLRSGRVKANAHDQNIYRKRVGDFKVYMEQKEMNVLKKKYLNGKAGALNAEYRYLYNRFIAIERAIVAFLGRKALNTICAQYEHEMTQRILQAREH
jgi:hypothetical protein